MMCGFTLLSLHSDSTGPYFLWIIHGSPVEGRLNWDVVLLSRVLGGSRALGQKFFVVPNIGAGTREMRAMMVWGLSLCLATAWVQGISLFWRVGLGSCRPLPASRAEAWNVHGVAHVVTGPCPGGAAALPWVYYCVYCFLPGFGLWGIVDAQYVLNTSSTSLIISHACLRWTYVSNHLTCLSALDLVVWGMLDGAIRGRCLIVLWGRERCQRTGYTAVMVAVVGMPGCGLGGIWICILYFGRRYTW